MNLFSLKKCFMALVLCSLIFTSGGCFYLVLGGVGALGGYAISPDTVEGLVEGSTTPDLWQAAVKVVSIMGIIEEKNEVSGVLIAKIQGAHVTISIVEPITDSPKLQVKARKGFMPKIKLAQDVFTKVIQEARM